MSRDAFAARDHVFDRIDYFARTSWIAQASAIPSVEVEIGPPLKGSFGERMVREDFARVVPGRLVAGEPDIIVIDLVDERFDVVDAGGGAWVTDSDYLARTVIAQTLRDRAAPRLRRFDRGREDLFAQATRSLGPTLAAIPPDVPVLLHAAWYTPISLEPSAAFSPRATLRAARVNDQLARLGTWVAESIGPQVRVFSSRPERLLADPAHRWGLAMYHYAHGYYLDLLDAAEALAAGDEPPSAPRFSCRLVPPAHIETLAQELYSLGSLVRLPGRFARAWSARRSRS